MVKNIGEILDSQKYRAPNEIEQIKEFIAREFRVSAKISVRSDSFIIAVDNSALAGALRMKLPQLKSQLKTARKLIIRIE